MILNKGQEEAATKAVYWFKYSSEQYFSIAGYAGTGKSVVIAEIIRRLGLRTEEILPIAYTGQACTIMRTKGFANACTCHAGLMDFAFSMKPSMVLISSFKRGTSISSLSNSSSS